MIFFTESIERMRIEANGEIKINLLQCENCFVMPDKDGKLYAKNKNAANNCEIANLETRIAMLEKKVNELTDLLSEK